MFVIKEKNLRKSFGTSFSAGKRFCMEVKHLKAGMVLEGETGGLLVASNGSITAFSGEYYQPERFAWTSCSASLLRTCTPRSSV